jgi:large subunit ribosomal protein L25
MSSSFEIKITDRVNVGTGNSRRIRKTGWVPAILYGAKRDPRILSVDANKLKHLMENQAFYSSIITLLEEKGNQSVIVKEIQRHPAKGFAMHVDFLRVRDDETITMNVPLHFIGADISKGVKLQAGQFVRLLSDIEISCLPKDLPEFISVDVENMELNDMLNLSQIILPKNVTATALSHEQDPAIATIQKQKVQEVESEEVDEAPEAKEETAELETTE